MQQVRKRIVGQSFESDIISHGIPLGFLDLLSCDAAIPLMGKLCRPQFRARRIYLIALR